MPGGGDWRHSYRFAGYPYWHARLRGCHGPDMPMHANEARTNIKTSDPNFPP